jgi:pyruvate,water dikinase
MIQKNKKFILWFDEITKEDLSLVGGKNANLGEMYQNLTNSSSSIFPGEKIQVPYGFSVTTYAYYHFLEKNGLVQKIENALAGLDSHNIQELEKAGSKIRSFITSADFPQELEKEICEAYINLSKKLKNPDHQQLDVAVRSSATAEDLPDASFAGQQESYLNIRGKKELLASIRLAFASLFTNRAISYRKDRKFDRTGVALSVCVQKMVRSDQGSSGVMFTLHTESGFPHVVLINGSFGLGEYTVKGIVNPDEFIVFKPALKKGFNPIISKKLGSKLKKLVYSTNKKSTTKEVPVTVSDRNKFVLSDDLILKLAKWGVMIEEHYGKPMDIEWAYDAKNNEIYIVQARPETVESRRDTNILENFVLLPNKNKILTYGAAVGKKIGQGKAQLIKDPSQLSSFKKGNVLVTEITDPDWEPIMKIASAIVTNAGGRTSHAAIISRELGIPAVVGCGNATKVIKDGEEITVSCAEGEEGKIYEGIIPFNIEKTDLSNMPFPKTEIKMIVANPDLAFHYSFIPNNGVGLLRQEFIISNYIKVHPNALINYPDLKDKKTIKEIDRITKGYSNKVDFFLDKLSYGIATIAAAFYPNNVLLRFSDFKSNEYVGLIGGKEFEPIEENPMLGWRGASRYTDPKYSTAFALECQAVKRVREEMGLHNLQVMVPFCRTPEEGKKILAEMDKNGLTHQKNKTGKKKELLSKDLQVWVMAEIPSNILQVEEYADIFDGFSIGSNDLTQLTLGLDRDSHLVANIGNENNRSVQIFILYLIRKAHSFGLPVGICGQGPSDFPQFAEFLVRSGIDSISLNPDSVLRTAQRIFSLETRLGNNHIKDSNHPAFVMQHLPEF